MATQICPKCKEDAFTWNMDDKDPKLTIWGCYKCFYEAEENESDERICETCHKKTKTKLKDRKIQYWWCSCCNEITQIKEN